MAAGSEMKIYTTVPVTNPADAGELRREGPPGIAQDAVEAAR